MTRTVVRKCKETLRTSREINNSNKKGVAALGRTRSKNQKIHSKNSPETIEGNENNSEKKNEGTNFDIPEKEDGLTSSRVSSRKTQKGRTTPVDQTSKNSKQVNKPKSKITDKKKQAETDEESEADSTEYEVHKLLDVYFKKNGEREFLVRWKGYSAKDDTWEPERHLNCTELINEYMKKCDEAKNFNIRDMRPIRKRTERLVLNEYTGRRKSSSRLSAKPRQTYCDD
ncbi:hypothetical protein RUM44_001099 [Polyplax serrata]|uniref:Chromo domain-containing protein n=1 Tax=Polyplax serrata TaxID=468196 RepID=A0ABR1B6N7_POLSC